MQVMTPQLKLRDHRFQEPTLAKRRSRQVTRDTQDNEN